MTNEDVERAIDFLLKSQANSEARIEQTNEQLALFADTQREIMQVMTHTLRVQSEINESLRVSVGELATSIGKSIGELAANTRESFGELADRQAKTEEALARLAVTEERSERRLEALTKIIEEERGR